MKGGRLGGRRPGHQDRPDVSRLYWLAVAEGDEDVVFVGFVAVFERRFRLVSLGFAGRRMDLIMALYADVCLGFTVFFSTRCCWAAAVEGESARGAVVMTAASAILENVFNMADGLSEYEREGCGVGRLLSIRRRTGVSIGAAGSPHVIGIAESVETDRQQGDASRWRLQSLFARRH